LSKFSFANFQPTKSSVHFLAKLGYWRFFLLVPLLAKTSPKYLATGMLSGVQIYAPFSRIVWLGHVP
jgi:hypothetical protein